MKTVRHFNTARDKLLHIETEGCIVNIRVGLRNLRGYKVTSVQILPDTEPDESGESWKFVGEVYNILTKLIKSPNVETGE